MIGVKLVVIVGMLWLSDVGANAELDYGASLKQADKMLRRAGLKPESSVDVTSNFLDKLISTDERFIITYLFQISNPSDLSCKLGHVTYLIKLKSEVMKNPEIYSTALKGYIDRSYQMLTQICTRVLSYRSWAEFNHILHYNDVAYYSVISETFVGEEFSVPNLEYRFYERLVDRLGWLQKMTLRDPTYLLRAIISTNVVVENIFNSLGKPLPVNQFNHQVRRLYVASKIVNALKVRLPIDLANLAKSQTMNKLKLVKEKAEKTQDDAMATRIPTTQVRDHFIIACAAQDPESAALLKLVSYGLHKQLGSKIPDVETEKLIEVCSGPE